MNKKTASRRRLLGGRQPAAGDFIFFFNYWEIELKSPVNPLGTQLAARVGHLEGRWGMRRGRRRHRAGPDRDLEHGRGRGGAGLPGRCRGRRPQPLVGPAVAPRNYLPGSDPARRGSLFAENSCALAGGAGACRAAHLPLSGSIDHHGVLIRDASRQPAHSSPWPPRRCWWPDWPATKCARETDGSLKWLISATIRSCCHRCCLKRGRCDAYVTMRSVGLWSWWRRWRSQGTSLHRFFHPGS